MAEERDKVTPPVSPIVPDLPASTPRSASELDYVDADPSAASAAGVGTVGLGTAGLGTTGRAMDTAGAGTGVPGSMNAAAEATTDDPEVMRQQIERTREEMSGTLNELQHRLTPQHIADQAKASVREATVGRMHDLVGSASETATQVAGRAQDAAGVAVDRVREHPLPVALAGAGAGLVWWLIRRSSGRQTWSNEDMYDWDDADVTYDRDFASLEVRSDDDWSAGRSWNTGGWSRIFRDNPIPASIAAASIGYMLWNRRTADGSADTVGVRSAYAYGDDGLDDTSPSTRSRVNETARDVSRQAREKAGAIGDQVGETMRSAQARAGSMSRDVSHRVQSAHHRTTSQLGRWMQSNPMAVGVAAMAAGAVVGLTVPRTHAEDQAMGSSRDALVDKASDQAHHLKDQVKEQAQQLKDQVKEKVQSVADDLSTSDASRGDTGTAAATPTPGM